MRGAIACVLGLLLVASSGCGSRSELTLGIPDASSAAASSDAASPPDASPLAPCAVTCDAGAVCIHDYSTHDPPPPLPDGGVCQYGAKRFNRCWGVMDQCGSLPQGCNVSPSCSCPPLGPPNWPEGCECHGDGTFDCYFIGE
jgi:hypothetical protein